MRCSGVSGAAKEAVERAHTQPAPYRSYDLSGTEWLLVAGLSLTAEDTILSRK